MLLFGWGSIRARPDSSSALNLLVDLQQKSHRSLLSSTRRQRGLKTLLHSTERFQVLYKQHPDERKISVSGTVVTLQLWKVCSPAAMLGFLCLVGCFHKRLSSSSLPHREALAAVVATKNCRTLLTLLTRREHSTQACSLCGSVCRSMVPCMWLTALPM